MVAFHKELRVRPTIAAESMFRNKISTAWRSVLKTTFHDLGCRQMGDKSIQRPSLKYRLTPRLCGAEKRDRTSAL
jgi:hypothetical protein